MVGKRVATVRTYDEAFSYINSVKKTFHGDPAKFTDFLKLMDDVRARSVDQASFNVRVGQLFKDHPNLLAGFNVFLPDDIKIIIPPEPEQPTELPDNIEIKHKEAENLLNMIKVRFQRLDTHVPKFYVKIMEDYQERKKSKTEVKEEVIDVLYYHEDLIEEFLRLLQ